MRFSKLIGIILVIYFSPGISLGGELSKFEPDISEVCAKNNCKISLSVVREQFDFHGLASYFNSIRAYLINDHEIAQINANTQIILNEGEWFVIAGRFKVMLVYEPGLEIKFNDRYLLLKNSKKLHKENTLFSITDKSKLSLIAPELGQIRYIHLWKPLAWLAKVVESSITMIKVNITFHWGVAIILFSIIVKVIILPINIATIHWQRKVNQIKTNLAPKLAEIKNRYDGEEAHNRLMAAHKDLGVSPFYTLKPMLGLFIQIPILIAIFNALGEMPQLDKQSFLWIDNLAYPDAIGYVANSIPIFGNTISLLPFVMTIVTVISVLLLKIEFASKTEIRRQKRNLYLMAMVFFILFYAFPASMVLYWTLVNILHIFQQQLIKI